ncbi:TadE/TadG family type IV pilus assembly protein [Alcaligenes parafaecalis]|uniref:Pilus assembly protein n=1 Tax=Alcaligenes parafaecalis TaxID=171260 RepID=A0ABT3VR54_9BURK|nr:TadE family protein [Alcaligenes parafaecalis]MCX5465840.1 pilus assembly protein [Alcaligenes parafaecalis]
MKHKPGLTSSSQRQEGVAAIEFALMVGILLLVFSGIITFSSLFLAQQKMSHLVGDLSRQVTMNVKSVDQIEPFINQELAENYGKGKAKSDSFLHWFGDLSADVQSQACVSEPQYDCAQLSLKLDMEPGILSQTLDLLRSEEDEADQLRSLSAKTLLVLRRQAQ